ARRGLEFRIPWSVRNGLGMSSARGEDTGSIAERFHRFWLDGYRFILVWRTAQRLWLGHSALGVVRPARIGSSVAGDGFAKEGGGRGRLDAAVPRFSVPFAPSNIPAYALTRSRRRLIVV